MTHQESVLAAMATARQHGDPDDGTDTKDGALAILASEVTRLQAVEEAAKEQAVAVERETWRKAFDLVNSSGGAGYSLNKMREKIASLPAPKMTEGAK